jgi:hypothetical protein
MNLGTQSSTSLNAYIHTSVNRLSEALKARSALFFVHIAKSYAFVQRLDLGIVANSASHVYTHPAL